MTIQDRAALVLQQIDAALALAEKATPGQGAFSTITPVAPEAGHK